MAKLFELYGLLDATRAFEDGKMVGFQKENQELLTQRDFSQSTIVQSIHNGMPDVRAAIG